MTSHKVLVESYFKIKDNLVQIDEFNGRLPDEDYIYGVIKLQIDGCELLSERHCDLIDQLWSYLVDGARAIHSGAPMFKCYFPDQPLNVIFDRGNGKTVDVIIGDELSRVDRHMLVTSITTGGRKFFERMKAVVPEASTSWEINITKCDAILQDYKKESRYIWPHFL